MKQVNNMKQNTKQCNQQEMSSNVNSTNLVYHKLCSSSSSIVAEEHEHFRAVVPN